MRFRVLVYSILLCLVVLLLAANAKAETTYLAANALVDTLNGVLPESMEKAAFVHERRNANFRRAVEAGAKIVFGTDSSVIPHGDNAIQFSRMVEHGMTPMQAIQSATTVAAELMDWQGQTGAVAPGYHADIIAVNGNPLDDISVLEEVFFVMKAGVIYKHIE